MKKLNHLGEKKEGAGKPAPQDTQSSSAVPSSTSDMLDTTHPKSLGFRPGENFQGSEDEIGANIITVFADKLPGAKWQRVKLPNGQSAYALLFMLDYWAVENGTLKRRVAHG